MTNFMKKRFSVSAPITDAYAENYERTFGKREPKVPLVCEICRLEVPESESLRRVWKVDGPPHLRNVVLCRTCAREFDTCKCAMHEKARDDVRAPTNDELIAEGTAAYMAERFGVPKIAIARAEIEKWIERLGSTFYTTATTQDVAFVVESMKLILKAGRHHRPRSEEEMTPEELKNGIEAVSAMLQGDPAGDDAVAEMVSGLVLEEVKDFISDDDTADLAVMHSIQHALENPRMVAFLALTIKKCTAKLTVSE